MNIEQYMSIIAWLGASIYYLQSYKIFKTKSVKDISIAGFSFSLFTKLNWLFYGLYKYNLPLIYSGGIGAFGAFLVLTGVAAFKRNDDY